MGQIIANRYQIGAVLGVGGMGTVYEGVDTKFDQKVAVKLLHADILQRDPEMLERFRREGQALRDLNHPNIVKMLDAVQDGGDNYLVMEYVPGGNLNDLIQADSLSVQRIIKLAIDLADALTRAHKLNIIHRDLKPANVLIAEDGTLRLTDFGVAHMADEKRVTATKTIVGTIDYLPPEVLGSGAAGVHTDIWAFGVILFEMLTGQRPFEGADIAAVITAIVMQPVPDLEELCSDVPVALVDLVYQMLEKDPQTRISSVRHVGAALEDILKGRSTDTHIPVRDNRFATPISDALQRPKHNLPAQTTEFVGRDSEIQELSNLLTNSGTRLVSILGTGGMGKTRLAIELVQKNLPHFKDGGYIVELAPLSDPANIVSAVADAVGYQFHEDGRTQKQQILDYLSNKHLILIMDNYEHLMQGAALVTDILLAAPDVKILATSRQKLNQSSETVFNLEGMDFPNWETPADALEYAAVKLFMQSAKRARPDFELIATDLPHIARITRLVRGVPLGILLAAAWLSMLSPGEIAQEIQKGLDFLEGEMSDLPERHRSIRAVFDYSWNLMNEEERTAFMKLSVFRGGFTREAAQAVADAGLRTLMNLMNKSLIRRNADNGRYDIHELLRQYAAEKLQLSGEDSSTRDAHRDFFTKFVQQQEYNIKGLDQLRGLADIEIDFENIQVAWHWAVEQGTDSAVNAMIEGTMWFCTFLGRFEEGQELMRQARKKWPADSESAPLVAGRVLVRFNERSDNPVPIFERGLQIARNQSDPAEIAFCQRLIGLHYAHHQADDPASINRGLEILQHSYEAYKALNDKFYMAHVLDDMGWGYWLAGRIADRSHVVEESIALRREIKDKIGIGNALRGLATIQWNNHQSAESIITLEEAFSTASEMRDRRSMAWAKAMLGMHEFMVGNFDVSLAHAKQGLAIAEEINDFVVKSIASMFISLEMCVHRDECEAGMKMLNDTMADVKDMDLHADMRVMYYFTNSVLYAANREFDKLSICIPKAVSYIFMILSTPFRSWILPSLVILTAQNGQKVRAAQILALTLDHPESQTKWIENAPFFLRFIEELKNELGEEAYQAAWETGTKLDIDIVTQELLEVFSVNEG